MANFLLTSGDVADFAKRPKSVDATDLVTVSEGASSMANKAVFKHGQKSVAVAGTREQMAALAIPDGFAVIIKALIGNTGKIYVGDVTVDNTNGYELNASEFVTLKITNLNKVYLDTSVNTEGVSWTVESD